MLIRKRPKHTAPELVAGEITGLVVQKKNPNRVSIFINGAFAFGIYNDVITQFNLRKGLHLDVEAQEEVLEADGFWRARTAAMDFLAYRARSQREVHQKLRQKGFGENLIERVIAQLVEYGYLDDATFAQRYVEARFRNKGYGTRRIQQELRRLGVAHTLAQQVTDSIDADAQQAKARAVAEKRWHQLRTETNLSKKRKKLYDYLLRRGYPSDVVRHLVDELIAT